MQYNQYYQHSTVSTVLSAQYYQHSTEPHQNHTTRTLSDTIVRARPRSSSFSHLPRWLSPEVFVRDPTIMVEADQIGCSPTQRCAELDSPTACAGGYSVGDTPVPIPNTAVKPHCADGTAGEIRWESTSPPASCLKPPLTIRSVEASSCFQPPVAGASLLSCVIHASWLQDCSPPMERILCDRYRTSCCHPVDRSVSLKGVRRLIYLAGSFDSG